MNVPHMVHSKPVVASVWEMWGRGCRMRGRCAGMLGLKRRKHLVVVGSVLHGLDKMQSNENRERGE